MAATKPKSENALIGVIYDSSTQVLFSVYKTPEFKEIAKSVLPKRVLTPHEGWYEHDANEIMESIYKCIIKTLAMLPEYGYSTQDIVCIGITNQRETVVVWDAKTGKPLYNAIVWNDIRTNTTVDSVLAKLPYQSKNYFKRMTGLPVSTYFSAVKLKWLHDNVPTVREAFRKKTCKVGTIDSWIVWNLTLGSMHITDVTNASRTMLMNIETLNWDPVLLNTFGIHASMLPEIRSCSEIYGNITNIRSGLKGVPIAGIVGSQQASLLGNFCIKPGRTKNTYHSGCFLLCNTGQECVISTHGLLTTVAYKLGPNEPVFYALEGAVATAGHVLEWLEGKVRLMPDAAQAEKHAESVSTTGGVCFVPAFTGLFAPYWRKDARGTICGLTQYSNKYHIIRAAIESICFQTRDILECMYMEVPYTLSKLHCDGELTSNNLLLQLQADITGVPVLRAKAVDNTPFGAAMCAAQAQGINLCKFEPEQRHYVTSNYDTFLPTCTEQERSVRYGNWKSAVERSMGWVIKQRSHYMTNEHFTMLSSIPAGVFFFTSFALCVLAAARAKN